MNVNDVLNELLDVLHQAIRCNPKISIVYRYVVNKMLTEGTIMNVMAVDNMEKISHALKNMDPLIIVVDERKISIDIFKTLLDTRAIMLTLASVYDYDKEYMSVIKHIIDCHVLTKVNGSQYSVDLVKDIRKAVDVNPWVQVMVLFELLYHVDISNTLIDTPLN